MHCLLRISSRIIMQSANHIHPRFNSNGTYNYEAAIDALNALQSNAEYLRNRQADTKNLTHEATKANCIGKMNAFLNRSNIDTSKLKSVIHVAGTKGKGSTCALAESILRNHGLRTGFFSSPHLMNVTERIKIDGKAIDNHVFAKTFWEIYLDLVKSKDNAVSMPIYFQMLTLIAFKLFLEENVDVAILEVGIGGEYDSTNVTSHTDVVGITSLALDHTSLLGNTIDKIAWHKGGIMKKNSKAFTVQQSEEAMRILESRSKEMNCNLEVVTPKNDLPQQNCVPNEIFASNASLAMKLAETLLAMLNIAVSRSKVHEGILSSSWPGRFQIFKAQNSTFYIDGAHTSESLNYCSDWYREKTHTDNNCIGVLKKGQGQSTSDQHTPSRVLLFNSTGDRDVETHLQILHRCAFHRVYFVPNVCQSAATLDNVNHNFPEGEQLIKCAANKRKWCALFSNDVGEAHVLPSVNAALEHLGDGRHQVLITGSLHLVGSALQALANRNTPSLANAVRTN